MVPYHVKQKNQNEKIRFAKLLHYKGPDIDTVELLDSHYTLWLANPFYFWAGPLLPMVNLLEPQTQIVGLYLQTNRNDARSKIIRRCSCILLVKLRKCYACCSVEKTAIGLHRSGLFQRNLKHFRDTLASMIDAGYRYQNIEKALGVGSTIVLGKDEAESAYVSSSLSIIH